jgi:magnesium transporter
MDREENPAVTDSPPHPLTPSPAGGEGGTAKPHRRRARRRRHHRRMPPGTPPGTLAADPNAVPTVIHVLTYGPDGLIEREIGDPQEVRGLLGRHPMTWVDVTGLANVEAISAIGDIFQLHRLALEDVLNVHQRAKVEEYDNFTYVVARMAELNEHFEMEQLSMFIGEGFVLTFQEHPGGPLDAVRDRLRIKGGRVRELGVDYLAYALIDSVVDCYFPVLEHYDERLEALESEILSHPRPDTVAQLHGIRHDLLTVRRGIWPMREALSLLMRESARFVTPGTRVYLRDLYDHTVQIIDLTEVYREISASLMDVHLSNVSNRMNEIMKVLTIIATLFMPLSFIASLYGMNFENMPELHWRLGYHLCLALMASIAGLMIFLFWKWGWFRAFAPRTIPPDHAPGMNDNPAPTSK